MNWRRGFWRITLIAWAIGAIAIGWIFRYLGAVELRRRRS